MSDDQDAPKYLPLFERFWNKIQASMGFSVLCTVLLISLISLWIIGHFWDDGWKAEQWGPVAAWFGGMLTAGAVTLSLYQSRAAKKEADQNREDAERRHTEQIEERKEMRQIDSLKPVWSALTNLAVPGAKYLAGLTLVAHTVDQVATQRLPGNDISMLKVAQDAETSARQQTRQFYLDLTPFLMEAEMAFTEPLIIVDQEDVWKLVEDLYEAFRIYHGKLSSSFDTLLEKNPVDIAEIELHKKNINSKRAEIVAAAREHLAHARPMRSIHGG
ncbi:hypothetical protein RhoFasSB10_00380 [Rhodococcus fascians]|uniref:hypothetical protein n=1 Tax=Rhodococcoides fascians TaxID=1828 RepID=UPI001427D769|nr:hypothetical protein [Rhodococcus fascians]